MTYRRHGMTVREVGKGPTIQLPFRFCCLCFDFTKSYNISYYNVLQLSLSICSIQAAFIIHIHSSDPPPHSVGLNCPMMADTGTCPHCTIGDLNVVVVASGLDVRVVVIVPDGGCWLTFSMSTSDRVAWTRPM